MLLLQQKMMEVLITQALDAQRTENLNLLNKLSAELSASVQAARCLGSKGVCSTTYMSLLVNIF